MKKLLIPIFESCLRAAGMYWPYLLKRNTSQLSEDGWFSSVKAGAPVDNEGNPVPWMTYPFLGFIKDRLQSRFNVFEFGSGNSTMWFSVRVAKVIAVENDKGWHDRMKTLLPSNAKVLFVDVDDSGKYERACLGHDITFDIVIIDGRKRNKCSTHALSVLSADGVIVWDNTERGYYGTGAAELAKQGFRRLDFWGMGPLNTHKMCTTIFYRTENCLGI